METTTIIVLMCLASGLIFFIFSLVAYHINKTKRIISFIIFGISIFFLILINIFFFKTVMTTDEKIENQQISIPEQKTNEKTDKSIKTNQKEPIKEENPDSLNEKIKI